MRWSSTWRRLTVSAVAPAVLAAILVGCAGQTRPPGEPTDTGGGGGVDSLRPNVDTGYAVVDLPGADATRGALAGELPQPIESYVGDPVAFRDFVRSRGWVGRDRPRKCSGNNACNQSGSPVRTWLRIQAIEDAHEVDLDQLPAVGTVVLRIINVGNYTDSTYGIERGRSEWYFVLDRPPGTPQGAARQKLAKLIFVGGSAVPERLEIDTLAAPFERCTTHADPTPRMPYADFRSCRAPAEIRATAYQRAVAWMACAHGCCTSNARL